MDETLEILYQDEYVVAINKPSGLLVHKSLIDKKEKRYAMKILRDQISRWVYPPHRLDKPTSGVLLFALSKEIARDLSEAFKQREIKKTYYAVVRGFTPNEGMIDHPLVEKLDKISDKNAKKDKPAQEAKTYFKTISTIELPFAVSKYDSVRYSLVKLEPKTGRKHQLRRHMKHISHHILGDTKYGRGEHNKFIRAEYGVHRLLLHCVSLEIIHPYTNERVLFKATLDETFIKLFNEFGWQDKIEFYN